MYDFIVVGAGFAGSVVAERIANLLDKRVLIIEKRNHIGGNCFDYFNESGILIHKYGPHIFHTIYKDVWNYLSNFTSWIDYKHKVLVLINEKKVPIPFNLNTLYKLFPEPVARKIETKLQKKIGEDKKISILKLKKSDDKDLKLLGDFVYDKVFKNYSLKQWGRGLDELEPAVVERVPVFISRDDRYFQDRFQGIPKHGYTKIFKKMLSHPNIEIKLNTDFKDVLNIDFQKGKIFFKEEEFAGKMIFTGEPDELFNYRFGKLPYRSLKFVFKTIEKEFFQEAAVINYPNDFDYTRITEYKHLTRQKSKFTTFSEEYPQDYDKTVSRKDVPFYPIPYKSNHELYEKYRKLTLKFKNILLLGRLAEYKYLNMDLVIKSALKLFAEGIRNAG
ncbi:MAG: UDP-galactopyranose mutase [Armatimonadetes bacterium]|nr:UDP-galactopyranose mutase [Armatimonadota bacterium]